MGPELMPAAFIGHGSPMNALEAHTDYAAAVPTPDHFIPMLYFAGLAGAADDSTRTVEAIVSGYTYGSLSMSSYLLR